MFSAIFKREKTVASRLLPLMIQPLKIKIKSYMGAHPCVSAILQREKIKTFFASLDNTALPKWGLLLKERICSRRSKSFLQELAPIETGGNSEKLQSSFF